MHQTAHRGALIASIVFLVLALIANTIGLSIFFSEMAKIRNDNRQQTETETNTETASEGETGKSGSSTNAEAKKSLAHGIGIIFAAIFVVLFMFLFTGAAFALSLVPLIISIVVLAKIHKNEQGVGKTPFIVILICSCVMMLPLSVLVVMGIIHK